MVIQDVLDTMIGKRAAAIDPKAAQAHYEAAMTAEADGDRESAAVLLRKAVQVGDNAEYEFKLAYFLDLLGEEDEAVALYEQLCLRDQPYVNALLNLAVVYEDRGEIARAEKCLRQILDARPNHPRALEYMKDVQASKDMYYDEEHARDLAKRNALLDTPVTDFELSVRARNCLKKMLIRTLGDLLKITEAELMSYKNFGESSLEEIKKMLDARNLRLGQGLEDAQRAARRQIMEQLKGTGKETVLGRPVGDLQLSVRARKASPSSPETDVI